MALKLMYITNNPDMALVCEETGVDIVFIDLEVNGKEERQKNIDSVKSHHHISDISIVKRQLVKSKLLVRINPIYQLSKIEIDQVIEAGADIIMLPYFKTLSEVALFSDYAADRVELCLLVETIEATSILEEIVKRGDIKYIYIGINDLHLAYKKQVMFELIIDGTVSSIVENIKSRIGNYGFGGISSIDSGLVPANLIVNELHYHGANMVILSRSFFRYQEGTLISDARNFFLNEIPRIREYEQSLMEKSGEYFMRSRKQLIKVIDFIKNQQR